MTLIKNSDFFKTLCTYYLNSMRYTRDNICCKYNRYLESILRTAAFLQMNSVLAPAMLKSTQPRPQLDDKWVLAYLL